jgi:hypothetical protein
MWKYLQEEEKVDTIVSLLFQPLLGHLSLHEQHHNSEGHLHTHKINIEHLNSALIDTKLSARDTRVNTNITIYTRISYEIYKTEVIRRTRKRHIGPWFTNNRDLYDNIKIVSVLA